MFKKTLLATALSVAALNASAAVVAITGTTVSQEGSAGAASIAVANAVVTLGAEYTVNDTVTFTISGAEFDTALSVPSLVYADVSVGGDASGTMTLGLLNATATSVTFRITELTANTSDGTASDTITLSGMVMKTASVLDATGDISVAYSALTNTAQTLDGTGTLSDVAATVVAQFSSSVTKAANAIIDVDNDRQQFTAVDEGANSDTIVVTPVEAVAAVNDAAYTGATHVLKGDFSWMETDGDAGIDAAELAAAFAATGAADTYTSTINADGTEISIDVADAAAANTVEAMTLTFTNAGAGTDNAVLPTQSFTIDSTIEYNTAAPAAATKATATGASAGEWTLNGKVAEINYMPFGDNTQVIMRATNTSSKSGSVSVRYMLEGVDTSWNTVAGSITTLEPGVTNIADLVMDAIKADAGVTKGKVAIEVTANVPSANVTIYASYKVVSETDRGFIGNF